jgi:hypothetical protein
MRQAVDAVIATGMAKNPRELELMTGGFCVATARYELTVTTIA